MKEYEEKFRKAMIQNAQLDNEKSAIAYQVELYKDKFQDLEAAYSVLQVGIFGEFVALTTYPTSYFGRARAEVTFIY